MGTWATVAALVALALSVAVLAWLVHLGHKLHGYVLQAGEATRLLTAASEQALAEPADGKRKAPPPFMDSLDDDEPESGGRGSIRRAERAAEYYDDPDNQE
jgi:hypothetical protein